MRVVPLIRFPSNGVYRSWPSLRVLASAPSFLQLVLLRHASGYLSGRRPIFAHVSPSSTDSKALVKATPQKRGFWRLSSSFREKFKNSLSSIGTLSTIQYSTMADSNEDNNNEKSKYDDAAAYNVFASAAVDLSAPHVTSVNGDSGTNSQSILSVVRSVRDIDNNQKRRYLYSISYQIKTGQDNSESSIQYSPLQCPPVALDDSIQWRLPSPSGKKIAILQSEAIQGNSNNKRDVLYLWTNFGQSLERRIELPTAATTRQHGKVINDPGGFGGPAWNHDETVLVYAAERLPPLTANFFDNNKSSKQPDADSDKKQESQPIIGGQYTLGQGESEHWGEVYYKQEPLRDFYCVHVETGRINRVENVPGKNNDESAVALGQPIFTPDGQALVYVGWDAGTSRRLGLIHCQQRPKKLYVSSIQQLLEDLTKEDTTNDADSTPKDESYQVLTADLKLATSPRFSPPNETTGLCRLAFLAVETPFDTHMGCWDLHSIDWSNGQFQSNSHRVVVPQVWKMEQGEANSVDGFGFPGFFMLELPKQCFLSSKYLLATTTWGSSNRVVRVDMDSGSVNMVRLVNSDTTKEDADCSSSYLLCTTLNDGSAWFQISSCNTPPKIVRVPCSNLLVEDCMCFIDAADVYKFHPIATTKFSPVTLQPQLFDFQTTVQTLAEIPTIDGVDDDLPVQYITLLPCKDRHPNPPLIIVPHGGPHGALTTDYMLGYAFLCGHGGYAISLVNYRGSTGVGQASINALPTNIGNMDVKDVIAVTEEMKQSGLIDPDRIGFAGGSHGGFLGAHCTSQYPDLFRAAVLRNPVVNIASMVTASDIPDWCYVEACGSYNWDEYRPPTEDELRIMYNCSPIRYIKAVKTPTLIAIGKSDLRVPHSQGQEWYHSLRSMGVKTKLLVYKDDSHALDRVITEADHWINIKRWFDEHLL